MFSSERPGAGTLPVYEISPPALDLDGLVKISIAYDDTISQPERLVLARAEDGGTTPLESFLDSGSRRIIAFTDRMGSYGLVQRQHGVTPPYGNGDIRGLQNIPNPFAGSTTIWFELMRPGQARVEIISVQGRLISRLFEGELPPGRHSIEWDGTDSRGHPVASGLYMYSVKSGTKTATKKMVHLR
jgi:hypothetical protein